MASEDDAGKWARARAIAAEDKGLREEYREHKHSLALRDRFAPAGPAQVLRMFEEGTNEKGQSLSQFEFEALCERWCAVFGPRVSVRPDAHRAGRLRQRGFAEAACVFINLQPQCQN